MSIRMVKAADDGIESARRVVGYVRTSPSREWHEPSLEWQASSITQWCHANGLDLVGIVKDVHDGFDEDRAGLTEVLGMVERGEVAAVVVQQLRQISRRLTGLVEIVDRLADGNAALLTVRERFDTGSAVGRLMMSAFGIASVLGAPPAGGHGHGDVGCGPDVEGLSL